MAVDLHVHSTASDGTVAPRQIVLDAARDGLTALAITDHDTLDGVGPAVEAGREVGLDVFPGVEISGELGGREVHILGYFVDVDDAALEAALQRVRESRADRMRKMVRRLQALGVHVSVEDVGAVASGSSLGRPHLAAALVARGAVGTQQEAFRRYLRRGRAAYVDRYRLSPAEAIELIAGAGGISVLAHPGLGCSIDTIRSMVELGIGGLEAYHIEHTPVETSRFLKLARQMGLIATGGTDSHGPEGPTPVKVGQVVVPDECAEELRRWGRAHGRWPLGDV